MRIHKIGKMLLEIDLALNIFNQPLTHCFTEYFS